MPGPSGTSYRLGVLLVAVALAAMTLLPAVPSSTAAIEDHPPMIVGTAHVGAELHMQDGYTFWGCPNVIGVKEARTIEWLRDGVPLPPERQGETLRLLPEDRGTRISVEAQAAVPEAPDCPDGVVKSAETAPVAASIRAMGWTGNGAFDALGLTHDGRLVLYPRSYTQILTRCETTCPAYNPSWDEPRQVGQGWNIFDIVFSPGDFDGDGFNDLMGRDASGNLYLYPGDGDGGWLDRRQVGQGWEIFDTIVGPGDFNGDGNNDVLARDPNGILFLYPGDGNSGWMPRSVVGWGWEIMDKIIPAGDIDNDGAVDVFARSHSGYLSHYPADGKGGWLPTAYMGPDWDTFTAIAGVGSFSRDGYNDLLAIKPNGDLVKYAIVFVRGVSLGGLYGPVGPLGTGWNVFRELL